MKRASARRAWWYLAIGGVATLLALVLPFAAAREGLYLLACIQVAPVLYVAWRSNRLPGRIAVTLGGVGLLYGTAQLITGDSPTYESPVATALGLMATACIAVGLTLLLRNRDERGHRGLLGDALIVALGSWIISWALLVQPIVGSTGHTAWSTVLYGAYQPTTSVGLFLIVVLLLNFANRPVSMWMVAGALTCNMLGDLLYALIDAGHVGTGADRLGLPLYVAGYFTAGAAFLHPSLESIYRSAPPTHRPMMGRLIVTTSSLAVTSATTLPSGPSTLCGPPLQKYCTRFVPFGT